MSNLNTKFYTKSYNEYGISAKGLHWNSKHTQFLRFEIITDYIKNIESSSIIDIGCGFGDYISYLKEKNLYPNIYLGLDCEEFMIEIASKRYPKNTFLKCNILKNEIPKADYLICSGGLNILNQKEFLQAIKNCFRSSQKGFIFNFLIEKSLHQLSLEEIYFFCKTLSKKVSVREDYLANDSTIFLEK